MAWFGRLLYVIERHNSRPHPRRGAGLLAPGRRKQGRPRAGGADSEDEEAEAAQQAEGGEEDEEEGGAAPGRARGRGSAAAAAARQRLQAEVAARRAALAAADLRSEPGLSFWLARQQRRRRRQELPSELELMLQLAGVQLDPYGPGEWQVAAHSAAALLQGSAVRLGPPGMHPAAVVEPAAEGGEAVARAGPQQQQQQQQQQQRQARAAEAAAAPAGSARLRVARWVQTQQALWAAGKLSPAQLRYMAFLGERRGSAPVHLQASCAAGVPAARLLAALASGRRLHAPPRAARAGQTAARPAHLLPSCPQASPGC